MSSSSAPEARDGGSANGSASNRFPARRALWCVLGIALVVRLAFGLEHAGMLDYGHPVVDGQYHDAWARHMLGQDPELRPGQGTAEVFDAPSLRPVGYPWFLALIYLLFGGSIAAALWVQHGLGLLAVWLVWRLLAVRAGPVVAFVAALLMALHFAPIYFEGELHATSLLMVLNLVGLEQFLRARETGRPRRAGIAGLVLGLAALVRPNVLLPSLLLLAMAFIGKRQASDGPRWRWALAFGVGLVLGVLPGAIRNTVVGGEFIPLTATSGINLYLGQGPGASGLIDSELVDEQGDPLGSFKTCFDYASVKARVEQHVGRELTYGELNAWFRSQAVASMQDDPGRALGLLGRKAALLVSPEEVGHNKEVGLDVRHSIVLRFLPAPFVFVLALLLIGMVGWVAQGRLERIGEEGERITRRGGEVFWVNAVWLFGLALSLLPFFAAARYRVPLFPHVFVLAALGSVPLWQARGTRRALVGLALVALLLAFGLTRLERQYAGPYPHKWHLDRAMTAAELGQLDVADGELAEAEALAPSAGGVRLERAILALRREAWDQARQGFQAVLQTDPEHAKAHFNLGWLAQREGRSAAALEAYRRAHVSAPGMVEARAAHGALIRRLATDPNASRRNGTVALKAMQAWLGTRPPSPAEWELLAACQAEVGDFSAALESIRQGLAQARKDGQSPQLDTSRVVRRLEAERDLYESQQPLRLAPQKP